MFWNTHLIYLNFISTVQSSAQWLVLLARTEVCKVVITRDDCLTVCLTDCLSVCLINEKGLMSTGNLAANQRKSYRPIPWCLYHILFFFYSVAYFGNCQPMFSPHYIGSALLPIPSFIWRSNYVQKQQNVALNPKASITFSYHATQNVVRANTLTTLYKFFFSCWIFFSIVWWLCVVYSTKHPTA